MRLLMKAGLFLMALVVVLLSLPYNVLRAQGVSQPRDVTGQALASEIRPVDAAIVAITLNGPVNLTLKQGAVPAMTVRAEPRLLPQIRTMQQGAALEIDIKGIMINVRQPMVVELTLPALQQLQVRGSGDSQVSGFSGSALELSLAGSGNAVFNGQYRKINASVTGSGNLKLNGGNSDSVELALLGSGDITASGASKSLTVRLQGSGDLNGRQLVADTVSVGVLGSGDAVVFARNAISVASQGSGEITIVGKPAQRSVSISGSGGVRWE